jgi:hypothetical protein
MMQRSVNKTRQYDQNTLAPGARKESGYYLSFPQNMRSRQSLNSFDGASMTATIQQPSVEDPVNQQMAKLLTRALAA